MWVVSTPDGIWVDSELQRYTPRRFHTPAAMSESEAHPDILPFSCTYTAGIPDLLAALNCSLVVSTYQAGKVIVLSAELQDGQYGLVQLPRNFDKPMGLAVDARTDGNDNTPAISGVRLAVATREEVVVLASAPMLTQGYPPAPGRYDTLFAPRTIYYCGELDLHDMAWDGDTLWAVNTRFSCLCHIDTHYSFTPKWAPAFVSDLTPDDRCHLNGLALVDGKPEYVTALGATDGPEAWREDKINGGILVHVPSNEIVLCGLPMPHSPRVYDGGLYMLNSATGELVRVDPEAGILETVVRVPGFVRGLARHGDYLFVGMSKLRRGRPLGDISLAGQDLFSGVALVHLPSSNLAGFIRYLSDCEEIYDVQVLPDMIRPGIIGLDTPLYRQALATPPYGFWSIPPENEATL
jgi:uncharacterized protein (TIGR03032 family)